MDDPSLARERTALAWQRTAFALAAAGAATLRVFDGHAVVRIAPAVVLGAGAVVMWRVGRASWPRARSLRAVGMLLSLGALASAVGVAVG